MVKTPPIVAVAKLIGAGVVPVAMAVSALLTLRNKSMVELAAEGVAAGMDEETLELVELFEFETTD